MIKKPSLGDIVQPNYAEYKSFIEQQPCLIGFQCEGDIVGHHEYAIGSSGHRKTNPRNYTMVPLCWKHHQCRHDQGLVFWGTINVWKEIARLIILYLTGERLGMR